MSLYGVTAVRYDGTDIVAVRMGAIDPDRLAWLEMPVAVDVHTLVEHINRGDVVQAMFPAEDGQLQPGPVLRVVTMGGGLVAIDTGAQGEEVRGLSDLPPF